VKTFSAKKGSVERRWWVLDATDLPLGRLASRVALILQGKNKPVYTPHVDTGDFVIVVNAEKVAVSGRKAQKKTYFRHSGYPGGARSVTFDELMSRHPDRVIRHAVRGMLPKNRLARNQLRKLKIYSGPDHPHSAQQPQVLAI
jgi:large subunit ribosomal protein L13